MADPNPFAPRTREYWIDGLGTDAKESLQEETRAFFLEHRDDPKPRALLEFVRKLPTLKVCWKNVARIYTHWYEDPVVFERLVMFLADACAPGSGVVHNFLVESGDKVLPQVEEAMEESIEETLDSLETIRARIIAGRPQQP